MKHLLFVDAIQTIILYKFFKFVNQNKYGFAVNGIK